jgi:radical SAM protein with 4Fe4S-binding SPASM domain
MTIEKWQPVNFGGQVRLPYPSNLILDIHSYCNASCKTCPYPATRGKLSMGFMDEALFRRIVDEFADIAGAYPIRGHVIFCNMGELFMDPRIFEKISFVVKAGLQLVVQTNAYLLTPERVNGLLATGFHGRIYISCHGITPEVYRRVMGLDITRTLSNIAYLAERYPRNLIQIRAIPYQWPLGEVIKVKNYWRERGISVKIFLPNARAGLVEDCVSWKLKYPGNKLSGCKKGLPLRDMVISFNGDAVLCCEDMGRRAVLGNVTKSSILDVWNSDKAIDLLDKLFARKPSEEDFLCKTCEFGVSTHLRKLVKVADNELHRLLQCYI